VVSTLPKAPKNLSRKCGKSKSASKIKTRRSSHPTKNRLRTITTYCSTGTRTVFYIKQVTATPKPTPAPPAATPKNFRLTLLHNNDGESKYVVGDSIANYGGITRFKTVLDGLRKDADNTAVDANTNKGTVFISSGDNYLAGLNLRASFQRFDAGNGPFYDSQAIDQLGYDAVTIGNHEYDFGPGRLAEFIGLSKSQFITANTNFIDEPILQQLRFNGRIADSVVVDKGGEKIGIIGVSPPETPTISSSRNVHFSDDVINIVNTEAARLTAGGVNKIILSSHLQNTENEKKVVAGLRNVDIVISGGADDLLANAGTPLVPNAGNPVGPYPTVAKDSTGADVPIVTTQGEYRYVGRLTVTFDPAGHIVATDAAKSGPVRVTADPAQPDYVAEDAGLKSLITDPLNSYKANLAANVIGNTDVLLDGGNPNPIRLRESNLGDLVADGFLAAVNRTAVQDGRPLANVAFSNGGGIRTSIPAGNITEKSTFDVLPFDNVLVTVPNVSRARFKELMEWGVAALPSNNGRFPQIAGFRMTVNTSGTAQQQDAQFNVTVPGTRITSLTLTDGTPIVSGGAVVPGPAVNLATTNFTANNGDSYPFRGLPQLAAGVPYQQSLYDHIVTDLGGVVRGSMFPLDRITIQP